MMRINVAGAGAGKTTCMASYVAECSAPEGKVIFFIAFTNAAIKNIEEKILKRYGYIPDTIRISTIHSFFLSRTYSTILLSALQEALPANISD